MQWKNEVISIINRLFEENLEYEGYLRVDDSEDISNSEIMIGLDTIIDRDYYCLDSEFTDKDYFEYLKMFEKKAKKFISEIDLSDVSENVILLPSFYDFENLHEEGLELYDYCKLNIRLE